MYVISRGHWCKITVLNLYVSCEHKSDDVNDRSCEELGHVSYQFPRYNIKILLADLNAKIGREDIFKATIGKESS
jgi:hypothetical protein